MKDKKSKKAAADKKAEKKARKKKHTGCAGEKDVYKRQRPNFDTSMGSERNIELTSVTSGMSPVSGSVWYLSLIHISKAGFGLRT